MGGKLLAQSLGHSKCLIKAMDDDNGITRFGVMRGIEGQEGKEESVSRDYSGGLPSGSMEWRQTERVEDSASWGHQ